MGNTIIFIPQKELDASVNLSLFIKLCRDEIINFGRDLDWDAVAWNISDYVDINGSQHKVNINWTNFDTGSGNSKGDLLQQPFIDFAKAYIRYQHSFRPLKAGYSSTILALRALERALVNQTGKAQPEKINISIINDAADLINARYAVTSRSDLCCHLKLIAELLSELRLTATPIYWENPYSQPIQTRYRAGERLKSISSALPSQEAIAAITSIFSKSNIPIDIVTSSVVALLMSQPCRISEVLSLPNDEVEMGIDADGHVIDRDKYRLRWFGAKGYGETTKNIPTVMVDVVHQAISKLRAVSEEARKMAKWYDKYPDKIYLPKDLEHLRGKDLRESEIGQLIGHSHARSWAHECSIDSYFIEGAAMWKGEAAKLYRFSSIEKTIVSMLPRTFPILHKGTRLKFSDALLVVLKGTMSPGIGTSRCMFEIVSKSQISKQLGSGDSSIFNRNGFSEVDGKHIRVESHAFRRWYDTMMERNGFSQLEIALHSNRKDIKQNSAYNYVPMEEYLEQITKQLYGEKDRRNINLPISRDEAQQLIKKDFTAVHMTEFGFCIHDFAARPCELLADCTNCNDHLCVKGDKKGEERLKQRHYDDSVLLERAKQAVEEEYFGADAWVNHQETTVSRQINLIACLDDPDNENGTVFRLNYEGTYSKIGISMDQRRRLEERESVLLDETLTMMGIKPLDQLTSSKNINVKTGAEDV
jgi:hypothetical protein